MSAEKLANARWMSVEEAAAILGVPTVTLRRSIERNARKYDQGVVEARADGWISRKLGRRWRVLLDDGWMRAVAVAS